MSLVQYCVVIYGTVGGEESWVMGWVPVGRVDIYQE